MPDRHQLHLDPIGAPFAREVAPSEVSPRRALARCRVTMQPDTVASIVSNAIHKGDVLAASRIAGIQAAKRAAELLPMCHPVLVGNVLVNFNIGDTYVEVETHVDTVDRTGVEMEALTAATVAALCIYDMCKSADRSMAIENATVWEKSGGRSGTWRRATADL